jgi:hypothetical protein
MVLPVDMGVIAWRKAREGDALYVSEQIIPDIRGILAASNG